MAAAVLLAAGLLGVVATPAWAAPPANDNFANATVVTGSVFTLADATEATLEAGEPDACGFNMDHSVWYALNAAGSGTATIGAFQDFPASFNPALEVYTGSSLPALTLITCNDDSGVGDDPRVTFSVAASTTYYIRLGAASGTAGGSTILNWNVQTAVGSPDLTTTVTDSADPVGLGEDDLSYTVAVANNGTAAAAGVSTATTLSGASATIVSASSSQGSCGISAPTVTCALGSLAVSASASITVTVSPNATGTITATAVSSLTETDANPGDNTDAETTTVNNALGCTIIGTAGNDTLNGTSGNDVICGLGGNDTIDGKNGDDTLYGGDGDDIMGGGNGADHLYGQAGNDTNYGETLLGSLLYLFDNGNDYIDGGPGNDDLDGQNGNDTMIDTSGTDTMSGGVGNDSINVQDGTGGDTASGGLGSDSCTTDPGDTATSC
jgi:Ca2+-binding RTX toxin-like protein